MKKRRLLIKSKDNLDILLKEGEGLTLEFKEKYSPKIAQDMVDDRIEVSNPGGLPKGLKKNAS